MKVTMSSPNDQWPVDYISSLPNAIISYILSYLPTKTAVSTSILSKRWQYVWPDVPALDFSEMPDYLSHEDLSDEQLIHYRNFVDNVLSRNDVPDVRCFTLNSYSTQDYESAKSWVSAAQGRETSELSIKINCSDTFYCPREFVSRQRLVILKLGGFTIGDMGDSFHLPNLKVLHLVSLRLNGDLFLKKLILGCTALKELLIEGCYGFEETLYVESPILESLVIKESAVKSDDALPFITIKAPNLRFLGLQDAVANYNIDELKLLTEANLDLWDSERYDAVDEHALELIRKLSGVTSLRFGRPDVIYCFENDMPPFENLSRLQLTADLVTYEILECAPNLKSLIFEDIDLLGQDFYTKVAPGCMSCLESFEVFLRKKHHIKVVEHILKVATALKELKVNLYPMIIQHERAVYQRLLDFPRSSPICQVKVVHLY
ncbi:hypothetical protein SOVF_162580 [Spinacia oleracea]|uniref:F-box/FBD/LRR-repeat protein At1g78750-like n=1 Tax=Spinacia oleracea TaxID=3562 RepID=A0A9R0IGV5_SPIOL|nr:F-box/FBD/LRR-repeat protein At1g78750-like [Spinacia oleracea]XP_021848963.1 F-box/FBD/LRR-repeat protein At1g78750-like [Spinacia oleracea]KNA08447.1 hypothetical protein SOVF_162580 [Spinacia oleracea]